KIPVASDFLHYRLQQSYAASAVPDLPGISSGAELCPVMVLGRFAGGGITQIVIHGERRPNVA
ncbi:MAG TPA: hypothetical protein VGO93_09895, partial [Candidatus Xenobia bacterium]